MLTVLTADVNTEVLLNKGIPNYLYVYLSSSATQEGC
jgi:hypothetical protein